MWALLLAFGLGNFSPSGKDGLPVAPVDVEIGRQTVQLRKPLYARSPGAHLVLFVRDRSKLKVDTGEVIADFEAAVPTGSVTAYLGGPQQEPFTLVHNGYSHFRGYTGLVLSAPGDQRYGGLYNLLELESSVPLEAVRFVWLSRGSERVEDIEPSL